MQLEEPKKSDKESAILSTSVQNMQLKANIRFARERNLKKNQGIF